MTPKEKAQELIEKFSPHCYCFIGSGMLTNTQNDRVQLMNAKQCALIAVDQLIESITEIAYGESGRTLIDFGQEFWQEVKQELEKP